MVTQEFYIRNASDTEARGPFTHEHLISLAENGQITKDTLYYEASKEQWMPISDNPELVAVAFPEKKSLKLKARSAAKAVNVADNRASPISVDDMLAAAEGRTDDTADKLDPALARARAAAIGLYSSIVLLLILAAAFALPSIDVLVRPTFSALLQHPLAILGCLNAVLAILLALQVTQAYPAVRFSAALGIGLAGFLLWTQGQTVPLIALSLGSAGLYLCTLFINFVGVGLAAGIGLVGLGGYAFFALTT